MLEEIGETLRSRRESLGLTLEDVQRATKVRSKYLVALEEGDGDSLPADVYTRGIIRRYCQEIRLDPRDLLDKFDQWRDQQQDQSLMKGLASTPGSKRMTLRPGHSSGGRWRWVMALVLLIALSSGAVYYFIILPQAGLADNGDPVDDNGTTEPPEEPPAVDPDPDDPAGDDEEPPQDDIDQVVVVQEQGPGRNDITYRVQGVDELVVRLNATARCWISLSVDGAFVQETTLVAGDEPEWTADAEIYIRAGNPAGLTVIVNDEDMGVPDEDGPRNLYFQISP